MLNLCPQRKDSAGIENISCSRVGSPITAMRVRPSRSSLIGPYELCSPSSAVEGSRKSWRTRRSVSMPRGPGIAMVSIRVDASGWFMMPASSRRRRCARPCRCTGQREVSVVFGLEVEPVDQPHRSTFSERPASSPVGAGRTRVDRACCRRSVRRGRCRPFRGRRCATGCRS